MFGIRGRTTSVWRAPASARGDLAPARRRCAALIGIASVLAAVGACGAAPALANGSPGAAYGGETSQHLQAYFLLSSTHRTIKDVVLVWHAACHFGDSFEVNAELGTLHVRPDGSFAKTARNTEEGDRPSWSDYWVEQISGRVSEDRITGSFHGYVTTRRSDGSLVDDCDSLYVTFKAIQ